MKIALNSVKRTWTNRFVVPAMLGTLTVFSAAPAATQASTITQWNFNSAPADANTSTGTLLPSIGAGTTSLVGGTTGSFASGDASGGSTDPAVGDDSARNTTTYPAQGTNDKTAGIAFAVSTVGFQGITVNWDQRHSNTASRYIQFQYSTDGTSFVDFGPLFDANVGGDVWYNNRSVDLSTVPAVNNNANFAFRVVSAFAPSSSVYAPSTATSTYGVTGTQRFDMVTVSGVEVPEPAALSLCGLAMLSLLAARRNRLA